VWAGWPLLKLANIQLLEGFLLLHMAYLLLRWMARGFTIPVAGLWRQPGKWQGLVMLCIVLVSMSSVLQPRYPPIHGTYFLSVPGLVVVMRLTELGLCVFYGFYAAELMRRDSKLREYAMKCYVWSAVVSAWIVFACFPLYQFAHIEILVYGDNRGRGGFTEGGPWGMYLVTAAIVARILTVRKEFTHRQAVFVFFTMAGAFLAARSKSSAALATLILLVGIFWKSDWRQKITSLIGIGLVATAFWFLLDVPAWWQESKKVRLMAEVMVQNDPANPNVAYGRIAAAVIVPRMIAAHPLLGIGFGHYSVMRNDPEYLGIMYPVEGYDLPGLGVVSMAAELGIPCLVALFMMMLYPAYWANKTGAHRLVFSLALAQPLVTLLGANVTFIYPWLISGFALSFMPLQKKAMLAPRRVIRRLPAGSQRPAPAG